LTVEGIGVVAACVGVGVQVIYGFRWITGLESRITSHEKLCDARQRWLDERHQDLLERLDDIRGRL